MKRKPFQLFTVGGALLLAASLPALARADEGSPAIGSVRPAGKVKPADLPDLAKLSFEAAVKAALTAVPGKIIKAELEVEDGNLMYSFEIVGVNRSITEVEIDAGNGKVLDIDRDEPGHEEKDGKK